MKKLVLSVSLILTFIIAREQVTVDIQADSFEANQLKNIVYFKGNVKMIRDNDKLNADGLDVFTKTNDQNESIIEKYIAIGNVLLELKKPTTTLKAKGEKIMYNSQKSEYIIEGNGYLEDTNETKIIKGEKIYLNEKTNHIRIDGKAEKPVEFKFKMDVN